MYRPSGVFNPNNRIEKEKVYEKILNSFDLNLAGKTGIALSGINLKKYQEYKTRLSLRTMVCVESNMAVYQSMSRIQQLNKLNDLILVRNQITDVIHNFDNIGFIDFDFMTYWANALFSSSQHQPKGLNLIATLHPLFASQSNEFLIITTVMQNRRNKNNPKIRKVVTKQIYTNLLNTLSNKFGYSTDILEQTYHEKSSRLYMECVASHCQLK